jgi:class 3 adenylate cyclase
MLTDKRVEADNHPSATIVFSDLVGFTNLTNSLSPEKLVAVLNDVFSMLDQLTEKHGVEKVKTVGDAYIALAAKGLSRNHTAESAADFAIEMVSAVSQYAKEQNLPIQLRVGMSTGMVISGVLGLKRLSFDLWGETVNLASRLEASSLPGRIQICETTFEMLGNAYEFESCSPIFLKGIGTIRPHYLLGRAGRKEEHALHGADRGGDGPFPLRMTDDLARPAPDRPRTA